MALRSSDAKLHEVTCKHLDLMLGRLHQFQTYVGRIRSLLTREFSRGRPTAEQMARLLGTSVSTLARRLETEGTTFSAVFRETQKDLALGYLARPELTVYQVATLSGFAHTAAFHRAFRSWSGMTPLQYRRKRQGLGP
jgi:AraC-like DNA-binding protein